MKEYKYIHMGGYVFACEITKSGKPGKLEKDVLAVAAIMEKGVDNLTVFDRLSLLQIYNVAYHESGKIEGVFSLDSSATNCDYCAKMRAYAAAHPELNCVCGHCYDYAQEQYKVQALGRHTLNMYIMQTVEFTIDELATLPGGLVNRVNSSGDAPNYTYAANMIKYCFAHPAGRIAIWSKNTAAYIQACDKYGKPGNAVLIQSSPFIDKPVKLARYFDHVFTVYKNKNAVEAAIAGGACECNGKKCRDCGYKCYMGTWAQGANIAELLR